MRQQHAAQMQTVCPSKQGANYLDIDFAFWSHFGGQLARARSHVRRLLEIKYRKSVGKRLQCKRKLKKQQAGRSV